MLGFFARLCFVLPSLCAGDININTNWGRVLGKVSCTKNLPLEEYERTCLICYSDSVEDEFHFVFNCNKYSLPRHFLFQQITVIKPNFLLMSEAEN